ncbi:MAG: ribonuclease PH [Candidatus Coatesbacteria bacterium]|nr:ribonuclease PH [Candidatus Coatesbacteria bacterium]
MPLRYDNRQNDELREVKFTREYIEHAEGSVLVEFGKTRVICTATVGEGVPSWLKGSGRGWVTAEYDMLPRATSRRNTRDVFKGQMSGRSMEIGRLIGRSLRAVTRLDKLGERTVTVDCDVISADGGTRTAAITGGYLALHDALSWLGGGKETGALPLDDYVAAISVGYVHGELLLDLCYREDVAADVDCTVVMTGAEQLIELQATAEGRLYDREMLGRILDLGTKGIHELIELQKKALES